MMTPRALQHPQEDEWEHLGALRLQWRSPADQSPSTLRYESRSRSVSRTVVVPDRRAARLTLDLLHNLRIYDFPSHRTSRPVIVDGGSWVGLSALRFKEENPDATVHCFEPHPGHFDLLQENLRRNGFDDIRCDRLAIRGAAGPAELYPHKGDASSEYATGPVDRTPVPVDGVTLDDIIVEPTDLVKLNVEGSETPALLAATRSLSLIDQLLVEYHGFSELPQSLHTLLGCIHDGGFRYVVSSFDDRNTGCRLPLAIPRNYRYFLLIYARRWLD